MFVNVNTNVITVSIVARLISVRVLAIYLLDDNYYLLSQLPTVPELLSY